MAQYDLLLTQNVAAAGIEFSEKNVNIAKGGILSAIADGTPTVLAGGTDGYQLVRDDAQVTGLNWVAISAGHTQGTDSGTTGSTFDIDSDGTTNGVRLKAATGVFELKNLADDAYAAMVALSLKFGAAGQMVDTIETAVTDDDNNLPTSGAVVDYVASAVSAALAANDAMIYKGTVGSGGTIEKAALEALATYNAGWTYRVITAGTYFGVVAQVGDLIIAIVDRAGSGDVDTDWTVIQTNLDGAVIGPASVALDGNVALFDGTTGKIIKDGGALGTMAAAAATDYVAKALFDANTILFATSDDTPVAVLGTELPPKVWAEVPADKIGTGWTGTAIAGQVARDDNFFYVCKTGGTATNQAWLRSALATNWT